MEINLSNLVCGYQSVDVIGPFDLTFKTGEFTCILGCNGIGKTTLFKTILNFIPAKSGTVFIDDKNIQKMNSKELASYISYVPQAKNNRYQYTVIDIILMGRVNYIKPFESPSQNDYKIVNDILSTLSISHLAHKLYSELSGGEQQIVLIARALVQEAKFIFMDEPASNLDFENQKRVLDVLRYLSQNGIGVIMSSHAPDHAFYCGANVVLINKDKTYTFGATEELLTSNNLKKVYGTDMKILTDYDENGNVVHSCCMI